VIEIIRDCVLTSAITDNKVMPDIGTICEVSVSSGKTNGDFDPTRYSFHKLEADGSTCYLGTLNEHEFDDAIEKGIIRRQ